MKEKSQKNKSIFLIHWKLIFIIIFSLTVVMPSIIYVYNYYRDLQNPQSPYKEWVWLFSLIIQIILSIALAILVYIMSSQLPQRIYEKILDLTTRLREPLLGYDAVTNAILYVLQQAKNSFYSVTLTPAIGLMKDRNTYNEFSSKLLHIIQSQKDVQMICLDSDGVKYFFNHVSKSFRLWSSPEELYEIAENFVKTHLLPMAKDDIHYPNFKFLRVRSLPYQMCISDKERAVVYFTSPKGIEKGIEIVGFYTEDKSIVNVLTTAFVNLKLSYENGVEKNLNNMKPLLKTNQKEVL